MHDPLFRTSPGNALAKKKLNLKLVYEFHKFPNYLIVYTLQEPITYNMRYTRHQRLCASWSKTVRYSDAKSYPVVADYTKYAATIDDFIERYPIVTIETSGEAQSGSTFGTVCRTNFGSNTFETINFNNRNNYNEYICNNHEWNGNFNVGVEIGVGFKIDGIKLYLTAFINGWMYSAGAYERCLDFGLDVTSITFNPKPEKLYSVNLIS